MQMRSGERWRCSNSRCGCEVQVENGSVESERNPVCACGTVMKKPYTPPALHYLEFLRVPEPAAAEAEREEQRHGHGDF